MGIQAWQSKRAVAPARAQAEAVAPVEHAPETPLPEPAAPTATVPPARPDVSGMDWETLQACVSECRLCELHESRTQTVFGVGDRRADWLIIGEAPGKDEDLQGEPFVGRAGQLLNAMLLAAGLKREQVYIANILKCRPPNNRDPAQQATSCGAGSRLLGGRHLRMLAM